MIKRTLNQWWPVCIIIALETILFLTNFSPNTYVVGWDNMFPEFNFSLNLNRTLSSVWQEYRGLGLMDGMSHAANLVHYCFLWLVSFVLPQHLLRYFFIFFTHLVGGIGIYTLLRYLTKKQNMSALLSLIGTLVYQYCFATVQMYYLPFEVFITHFAALPWLIRTAIQLLDQPTKKHFLLFTIVSFLSTPQAHVPTVFIVYCMVLTVLLVGKLVASNMRAWKTCIIMLVITFCVNAFWGIPFAYATLHGASTITESKNNQISTEDTFQKNRAFGDITSVALMNSFSMQYMQYDFTTSSVNFMLLPWISHNASPYMTTFSWILFGIAFIGVIGGISSGLWWCVAACLYCLSVFFIGNDIPVIRQAVDFLRAYIPLFGDIFRFVFTKFFFLFALTTGLMAVSGIITITKLLTKKRTLVVTLGLFLTTLFLLGATTLPSFTGNFVFRNLRVRIPQEYFDVFSFFQKRPVSERVLIYPMPWYWAWTQYRWGVIGSGFTWFGIPQATIDRAFDPWSDKNENVYWELTQAVYASNAEQFRAIVKKYDIHWILFDEHIIHAVNDKALYLTQFDTVLTKLPEIQKAEKFGRITLYHVQTAVASPVTVVTNVPNIGPAYSFNDNDVAATATGIYKTDTTAAYDIFYPERTVFTGRDQSERAFPIYEAANTVQIGNSTTVPVNPDTVVYDSTVTNPFEQTVRSCDPLRVEVYTRDHMQEQNKTFERFFSKKASNCLDIYLPLIAQRQGYLLAIETRHITGRRLSVSITNKDTKRTFMETFVTGKNITDTTWQTSYFVIPPMDAFGMGYTITFDNLSIGQEATINDIAKIRLIQIPYNTIVNTKIQFGAVKEETVTLPALHHPNPAYYSAQITQKIQEPSTLVLSQAFDSGWHAYTKKSKKIPQQLFEFAPFLFGKELTNHVLINNWANGWTITNPTNNPIKTNEQMTIVIFFLPQLLEWIGFLLIPVPFLFIINKRI